MRLAKIQDIPAARILIVWDGKKIEIRANVLPHVALIMTDAAHELALRKFLGAGGSASDIARVLRGES